MRTGKKAVSTFKKYFDKTLDVRVQIFNLLAVIGIIGGIFVAVAAVFLRESIGAFVINILGSAMSYIVMRNAEKKKNYHFYSWVYVLAAFFIFFPLLFFFCGGYRSGAAYIFVIAFVFTGILLEKRERNAALILEFILYILCCLVAYYRSEMTVALSSDFQYIFISLLNFTVTSAVLLVALLMRTRIFYSKQEQVQELNRELTARAETLARYDQMKSDFLATVAHEINTPLAVIAASSNDTLDLLSEFPLNVDEITENQIIIERRIKLIDNILLDLMDTVAIENGRLSLSRQFVSLNELLKSTCDTQFKSLDANNNKITYELQSGLQEIWADPPRIEQVMINLLSNAVRFTKDGTITIKLMREEKKQIVSVTDTGEGMDEEMARVVLRQYVSTKADYWRHGIGLYICRRIIIAHGGEIWIDSEKGRGTTISFSLSEEPEYE